MIVSFKESYVNTKLVCTKSSYFISYLTRVLSLLFLQNFAGRISDNDAIKGYVFSHFISSLPSPLTFAPPVLERRSKPERETRC